MTTKEEVLKLAEAAGFHINLGAIYSPSTWNECNVNITKLIELAKAQGAEDVKLEAIQACRECYSPDDTAADWDEKMADLQRRILMKQRIRERSEE